jgi:hypothetical protein
MYGHAFSIKGAREGYLATLLFPLSIKNLMTSEVAFAIVWEETTGCLAYDKMVLKVL